MTSDKENKEWLNGYAALKQVDQNNPFTVPDGYFDELGQRITVTIRLDELKKKMPLDGFIVPENYFEELNSHIQSRVNIEKILSAENTGFTVPENYFEELSGNIQSRVFIEEALSIENAGFTVPENYFEELNSRITSRVFVEEALMNTNETLTVPQDYFNQLNNKILNKTVNQAPLKRKGAVIRMFSSTAVKYATAACLTIMVGTGIFLQQFNNPAAVHKRSYLHKQLSNVPMDEIENYLELNVDETQHSVATEDLSVDDSGLTDALQNYTNSTQK